MHVEYLTHMGDDLFVVNAARVSYAKFKEEMGDDDIRLEQYLARHGHWTPFAHCQISFRVTANIAVARQLYRHQVGLAVNEVSRRYVNTPPTFDLPDVWRSDVQASWAKSKQGSGRTVGFRWPTKIARNIALTAMVNGLC